MTHQLARPNRRTFLGLTALSAGIVPFIPINAAATTTGTAERFRFGVVADCQYADADNKNTRYYRESPRKLREAVAAFNEADLDFAIHLGDFIDRYPESFDVVVPIFDKLRMSKYHVLGNHDFKLPLAQLLKTLQMPSPYHAFSRNGWRFVVVDTNDVSLYANEPGSEKYELAQEIYGRLLAEDAPNAKIHNGAVGAEQFAWLERTLAGAQKRGEPVVVNSHHALYPKNNHNAWNDDELVELVTSYDNVVAWFNGHNHNGNYGFAGGKHFVTFHGMLELDTNAYATVNVLADRFEIDGSGREPDRVLPFAAPAITSEATAPKSLATSGPGTESDQR